MDKIDPFTRDLAAGNFRRLAELFPEAVTETIDASTGQTVRAVDAEALRAAVGAPVLDPSAERYRFTCPDKRKAIDLAFAPTSSVLRPVREKSVGRDGTPGSIDTENLYIEGDNLEALKILRETYLGRVKMIYIDPPYNTGHDFVYEDDFSQTAADYAATGGERDETGNRLVQNTEASGRFHTDWLNMIYPRLRLAKDFLSDDGVIFISIDDNEVANLRKVCDEIFGARNFLCDFIWNSTKSVTNTALVSVSHTYNFVFCKNIDHFVKNRAEFRLPDSGEGFGNPDNDQRGAWKADPFQVGGWRPNQQYDIVNPKTGVVYRPNPGCSWKNDWNKFQELMSEGRIVFGASGEAGPQRKRYVWEAQERGKVAKTWWDDVETTTNGTQLVKKLFDGVSLFDNPKPVGLIERMLMLGAPGADSIVMDFFSGSATTAHAVMKLNAEDGGKRKFILVQLPEACAEGSEAAKAGYATICDIGEERIRRAGKKILEKTSAAPDVGFRVFRVDSANVRDVRFAPEETRQEQLELFADNVKEDRTAEDLLAQAMLSLGVPLSKPVAEEAVEGRRVFSVDGDFLVACFERDVPESVVRQIARRRPVYAVLRDASLGSDATMANFDQIFAAESPETVRRVL